MTHDQVLMTHRTTKERRKVCPNNKHELRHIRVVYHKPSGNVADEYHCDACGTVVWKDKP